MSGTEPGQHLEVEVKLRLGSVKESLVRLARLPARLVEPPRFEDNEIYDTPDRRLAGTGRLLRLRVVGERGLVTFKEPVRSDLRAKVRSEIETAVEDPAAIRSILEKLGFVRVYRYQKFRSYHAWDDPESGRALCITLDETPIGVFVELEGDKDLIDRASAAMGYGPGDHVLEDYRSLHAAWVKSNDRPASDLREMVFAHPDRHGRHER